jgi:peptidoglycan/LPS O-acetylase OafA/YrhL
MPPDWTSTSVDACCPNPGQRLDSLTGLRGLAALLVVGTHAAYGTGAENGSYVGLIFRAGRSA